ncbi:MAG: hypothetical protein HYS21_11085 [Deltaproteobacteria bacterium]|nr:hypothetical protein [Deltaproteobacteria bacterium]
MGIAGLISALFLFFLSGFLIVKFIDRRGELGLGVLPRLGAAFMLGLGAVSLQMFFYSVISIRFSPFGIALPWVAITIILFLTPLGKGSQKTEALPSKSGIGAFQIVLTALIALQVIYAFIYTSLMPINGWDAWAIWFLKAKAFFVDKGVEQLFFENYGNSHIDYPLMIPLSAAWIYTAVGSINEFAAKALYPLQYASMLLIFYYVVSRLADRQFAILFTFLLSLTPIVMVHGAGFPVKVSVLYMGDYTGYADLPLAIYFLGAASFFYLYMLEGRMPFLILATLFFAVGAWTKNEGLTFALLGAVAMLAFIISEKKPLAKPLILITAVLILFIAPWSIYKAHYHYTSEYAGNLSLQVLASNFSRLGTIFSSFLKYMFAAIGLYNFTWWLFFASLALNARSIFTKPMIFVNFLLFAQIGIYIFVYMISPSDINWHIATSIDRLLLHMAPLAMLVSAANINMFLRNFSGSKAAQVSPQ